MSNDVSIFNQGAQLPAHLQNAETNSGLITTGESLPRISIKGMQFKKKTKDTELMLAPIGQALDFVVLAVDPPNANVGKAYFESGFSGDSEKPDCSSADGIRPDHWIDKPQASACASCPKAVWGSKVNQKGNEVKACSDHKRLLVVAPDDIDGDVAVIQAPATSLKNLSNYGRQLNKHKAPLAGVTTRISFDQTSEYPKLCFDAVGYLDEATGTKAMARATGEEIQELLHHASEPLAEHETAGAEVVAQLEAPADPAPEVEKVLVATQKTLDANLTLEAFRQDPNWTDELLVQHGYAEYK